MCFYIGNNDFTFCDPPLSQGTVSLNERSDNVEMCDFGIFTKRFYREDTTAYDAFAKTDHAVSEIRFRGLDTDTFKRILLTPTKITLETFDDDGLNSEDGGAQIGLFTQGRVWSGAEPWESRYIAEYEVDDEFVLRVESSSIDLYKNGVSIYSFANPGGQTSLFGSIWLYSLGSSLEATVN